MNAARAVQAEGALPQSGVARARRSLGGARWAAASSKTALALVLCVSPDGPLARMCGADESAALLSAEHDVRGALRRVMPMSRQTARAREEAGGAGKEARCGGRHRGEPGKRPCLCRAARGALRLRARKGRRAARLLPARSRLRRAQRTHTRLRLAELSHRTPHSSLLTPHSSLLTPHSSLLTPRTSRLSPFSPRSIQPAVPHLTALAHRTSALSRPTPPLCFAPWSSHLAFTP
jgi:hypothetical protein